ncbi:MAG: D-tyrosyl-tRNA(Tyr) deacylase [Acidobacteriota bacterium]|jgi:D-tyrosyl-tRNA(Tyr) deacylase|nr:D-tyrosyl-tRNA(Tyr) deacylase [Acidobacteriota bacterium]
MRVVLQRVSQAEVSVTGETIGRIGPGLLALAAVSRQDEEKDLVWMARKIVDLRVFDDDRGNLNLSLRDIRGQLLVVSQFTLYGDCKKGRRPSYSEAAPPAEAEALYKRFVEIARESVPDVQTGRFQAAMEVRLTNDGPVTLILDSKGSAD